MRCRRERVDESAVDLLNAGEQVAGRIYLLDGESKLIAMDESPYDSETLLQTLLADHPDLLAGDQINAEEPRRWLLISREMAVVQAFALILTARSLMNCLEFEVTGAVKPGTGFMGTDEGKTNR